jgi:hypothetical protein
MAFLVIQWSYFGSKRTVSLAISVQMLAVRLVRCAERRAPPCQEARMCQEITAANADGSSTT